MKIQEKKLNRIQTNGSVGMVFALFHTVFWCIGICAFADLLSEDQEYITALVFSIVCVSLGVLWFCKSKTKKQFPSVCLKYAAALKDYSEISITELAAILNEDVKKVRKNITYMIVNRCIEGIHYTYNGDYVIVERQIQPAQENSRQTQIEHQEPKEEQVARVSVTCQSCCGVTMLPVNSVGVCDYCGSKIKS